MNGKPFSFLISFSVTSHSAGLISGRKVSACSGSFSTIVRESLSAKGKACSYMLAPPMMKHSSDASLLPIVFLFPASSFLAASASYRELNTSHPVICSFVFEITILRRLGKAPFGSDSNVFLPMIIVCPVVSIRNRVMSDGMA